MKIKIFLSGFILFTGIYLFGQVHPIPKHEEKYILHKQPFPSIAKNDEPLQNSNILKQTGTTNLVAYFPFNGNANDESGNESNPTYIGTGVTLTNDRFGNPDKAYYFDGNADSYIRIPADKFPTADRTISFWFNADQIENHPTPLSYGGDVCNNSLLMIINKGDYPNAYTVLSHCASNFISAPYSEPPINKWYNLTMTISGATQKIFINGELQQTVNTFGTPTVVAGKSAILGAILFTDGVNVYNEPTAGNFQGKMDDFRFYDVALTDTEVQNLYDNEASGLVAYYPFNGNANDESGFNNNPTYIGNGVTLTSDRFGHKNSAYYLDGTANSSYIRIPADNFPTNNRTISFWFNADEISNRPTPLTYGGNGCNSTCFLMNINNPNAPNAYIVQGHCNDAVITAPYSEDPVNKWYHFAFTINGSVQKIFINGVLQQTSGNFTGPTYVLGRSVIIGDMIYIDGNSIYQSGYAGAFKGKLDDFRFYNQAMTDSEVLSLYKSEAEDLVAFYPFDGNAMDVSGNGHDGTVYGGILTDDRNSNPNSAYTFPNLHNQITLDNTMDLNLQGGFTLNSWVKYKSVNSGIIGKHSCWVPNGFYLGIENQQLIFRICDGGWNEIRTSETFETDQWYMITAVFDSVNQTGSVFVDGQLKASGHAAYTVFNSVPITISEASNGCPDGNMPGAIDEVKIFDRPLSEAEIQTEYNLSHTGLVAYYPFRGNTNDESGNNLHLTNHGASLTADRFGIENNAYFFNGNANISRIDNDLLDLTKDFSISFWVKNPGSVLHQFVMSKHYAGEDNIGSWGIASYGEGNTYTFVATPQWGFGPPNPTTTVIPENVWHHITFNYKKATSEWKCFMDGLLSDSGTQPFNIQNTDRDFMIGTCMQYNSNLTASLDDLRVYTSVLTDQEIEDLYLSETTAPVLLRPENLSTVSSFTPLMEWENSNTNAEYNFQLSTEPGFAILLHQANTANSYFQLPDGILIKDITYYWRVRTTLNGETGPWSEVRSFNFVNTGIPGSQSNLMNLLITPNPADISSKVTYTVSTPSARQTHVSIEVINSMGKIINCPINTKLIPGSYEFQLNTEMMEAGIYFVRLKTGNSITVRKLVIVH